MGKVPSMQFAPTCFWKILSTTSSWSNERWCKEIAVHTARPSSFLWKCAFITDWSNLTEDFFQESLFYLIFYCSISTVCMLYEGCLRHFFLPQSYQKYIPFLYHSILSIVLITCLYLFSFPLTCCILSTCMQEFSEVKVGKEGVKIWIWGKLVTSMQTLTFSHVINHHLFKYNTPGV